MQTFDDTSGTSATYATDTFTDCHCEWGEIYGIRFYSHTYEPKPELDPISIIEQRVLRDAEKARQVIQYITRHARVPTLLHGHQRPFLTLKMPTAISGFRARKLKERIQ